MDGSLDRSLVHGAEALNRMADQYRAEANRLIAESRTAPDPATRDQLFWQAMAIGDRATEAGIAAVGF
jgi:hypothetical protein